MRSPDEAGINRSGRRRKKLKGLNKNSRYCVISVKGFLWSSQKYGGWSFCHFRSWASRAFNSELGESRINLLETRYTCGISVSLSIPTLWWIPQHYPPHRADALDRNWFCFWLLATGWLMIQARYDSKTAFNNRSQLRCAFMQILMLSCHNHAIRSIIVLHIFFYSQEDLNTRRT